MLEWCARRSVPVLVAAAAVVACANTGKSSPDDNSLLGDMDASPSGSSSGGGGGDGSVVPGDDGGPGIVISDATMLGDQACQHVDVEFLPRIPIVYVLADRSGSMFTAIQGTDGGMTDEWTQLRAAALPVIQGLQTQVAFGFGAYTGEAATMMCPILDQAPVALNNYSMISTLYQGLGMPMFKAETPAQEAFVQVAQTISASAAQLAAGGAGQVGGKYILFVTDGETDFCDDGNPVCPADAVTAELQALNTQGITTLILGIGSNQSNISVPVLQGFANAGAGLPVQAPPNGGAALTPTGIFDQCQGVAGWTALAKAAGLGMNQALATYTTADAAPAANAKVYSPDVTDENDLTNQIAAALNTVKSCTFDLQGKIKVDLTQASRGQVAIDGTSIPYDATNGWQMGSATEVDLEGAACQTWRTTGKNITFDFPCDVLVVLQ